MSVCKLFSIKDFSGTTAPRILKFGINIGYDLLYCTRENKLAHAYHSLYLSIFVFLQYIFVKDFSATTATRILKFSTNIEYDLFYCVRENQHSHSCHSLYLSLFLFLL